MSSTPRPHDLLWGMTPQQLPAAAPDWAALALAAGQPVVVRRAQVAPGRVAVGVRGASRDQRFAMSMRLDAIQRRLRPEQLGRQSWRGDWPALRALARLRPYLDSLGLVWGVTGSVAFELASGLPVLHQDSDLDLLLRTPQQLARPQAASMVEVLELAPCRVDLQLETPAGAVALREWATGAARVLLKSPAGARLVADPWQVLERAA